MGECALACKHEGRLPQGASAPKPLDKLTMEDIFGQRIPGGLTDYDSQREPCRESL